MSESPKPTGAHFDRPLGFQACVPEYDYAGEIRQPSGGSRLSLVAGWTPEATLVFSKIFAKPVNNRNFKWWVNFSGLF